MDTKDLYAHVIQIQQDSRKCWMHTADMCLLIACFLIYCLYLLVKVLKYVSISLIKQQESKALFSLKFYIKYNPYQHFFFYELLGK